MATIKGGDRLARALVDLARKVSVPATVRVGFLATARYSDGTPVAMIAAINEYGRPPIQPPRPFFRRMISAKQKEWPAGIATQLKAADYNAVQALDVVGAAIAGQLRQSISDLQAPPLAPSTVRRKGFSKPLVFSGHMLNSVDHEVKQGA